MLLIREIMYCKPGKVRPMVEKFLAMKKIGEKSGFGGMRIMTDLVGERYWTIVSEMEVESLEAFMNMDQMPPEDMKAMEQIMKDYYGRREVYTLEE